MKIWRLKVGPIRTNNRALFLLASWSYVTGYWRWAIYWNRNIQPSGKRFGWFGRREAWVTFPRLGVLSIQRQPPMESMKRPFADKAAP